MKRRKKKFPFSFLIFFYFQIKQTKFIITDLELTNLLL
jgi:hypothetical protein